MLKRIPFPLALAVCCLLLAIAAPLVIRPALAWMEEDDDDDSVHDLMEKTHKGRRSPWKSAVQAAGADPIDWATVDASLPRLERMSSTLGKAKNADVRDAADGYVDAVKELAAKTEARDAAGAKKAVASLSMSCADCHYKGGPGGKLED